MKQLNINFKPYLRKLEIYSRKRAYGELAGTYVSAFKGAGLEFDGYRAYDPQHDDAKNIDWRASMRARHTVVKEYIEERNLNILFLIDVSSSMSFGSVEKLKNEYAAAVFVNLSYAMLQAGDEVGLALFSDKLVKSVIPATGVKQYYILTREISNPENYEGKFDLRNALKELSGWSNKRAILIIISDFMRLEKDWKTQLDNVGGKFEIIGIMVRDPVEYSLPHGSGQIVLENPSTGEEMVVDCNSKKLNKKYEEYNKKQIKEIKDGFQNIGADFLELRTDKDFIKPIMNFFEARRR